MLPKPLQFVLLLPIAFGGFAVVVGHDHGALQFVLLLPIAFGPLAPRFFAGLFLLGLAGVALWWQRLVVALLLGER